MGLEDGKINQSELSTLAISAFTNLRSIAREPFRNYTNNPGWIQHYQEKTGRTPNSKISLLSCHEQILSIKGHEEIRFALEWVTDDKGYQIETLWLCTGNKETEMQTFLVTLETKPQKTPEVRIFSFEPLLRSTRSHPEYIPPRIYDLERRTEQSREFAPKRKAVLDLLEKIARLKSGAADHSHDWIKDCDYIMSQPTVAATFALKNVQDGKLHNYPLNTSARPRGYSFDFDLPECLL